jgi:hypothetical protein
VLAHSLTPSTPEAPHTHPVGGFCCGILGAMYLPNDVQNALKTSASDADTLRHFVRVLRDSGWTLGSIAEPLGVTREWVRQMVNSVDDPAHSFAVANSRGFLPPVPPQPVEPEERKESVRIDPDPVTLARMLELQPLAKQVRSNSPKYRAEGEEYTALLAREHIERGVPLLRLANALGVTHSALRFRLVRYGYKEASSTHRVYTPISERNRVGVGAL